MLVLCNDHIRSHGLNEHQEQIPLLGRETLILPFGWRGPGAHCVALETSVGHIMELCNEYKNCKKFQFYTEKVFRDIPFFVISCVHYMMSQVA